MTMDDEVRQPAVDPGVQSEATSSGIGRAGNGPSASSLRAAAGKVMATMAAKVQEVMPPSGRSGSAASFLAQEDTGSAGTVGSGYVTAGSEPQREAPLLYHGEDGSVRPTSLLPQLPHSTSSGSDQA
ncbi:TY5A, partial [Symbiodinium sp. KB8]